MRRRGLRNRFRRFELIEQESQYSKVSSRMSEWLMESSGRGVSGHEIQERMVNIVTAWGISIVHPKDYLLKCSKSKQVDAFGSIFPVVSIQAPALEVNRGVDFFGFQVKVLAEEGVYFLPNATESAPIKIFYGCRFQLVRVIEGNLPVH